MVVRKKEIIISGEGISYEVWPVSMKSSDGKTEFVSFISRNPPYLIKQVANPGTEREMTFLILKKLIIK